MHAGDVVVIIYQDKSCQFSKRRIRIVTIKKRYIIGYCFYRHQLRTFSTERIFSLMRVISA
jgi:predicted DNA-binding transcriptional regulator YafY